MSRFGKVPMIYTRIGLLMDNLIEVSKKYPAVFTRDQFVEVIGSKPTSTADKLRDMVSYGLIIRDGDTYTISEAGQVIIKGNSAERSSTIKTALKNNKVWAYLISAIGVSPNREVFKKALTAHYGEVNSEILENLWNAYRQDISSISSVPPFSKWSTTVRKSTVPPDTPHGKATAEQKEEIIVIPESRNNKTQLGSIVQLTEPAKENEPSVQTKTESNPFEEEPKPPEKIMTVSQDLIGLAKYLPSTEKITIEFGSVKFELRDESSIALAKVLIQVKEKGLLQGDDYERK